MMLYYSTRAPAVALILFEMMMPSIHIRHEELTTALISRMEHCLELNVQIWNLDELDPVESVCVLGVESTSSSQDDDANNKKTNNKKRKKKKKYD